MLISLAVQNFAVIRNLEIRFRKSMNVITGETGAGKSIVIDALGLILGDRANTLMIRDGENNASITAQFDISGLKNRPQIHGILDQLSIDRSDELEIRREISRSGKSRAFINSAFVNIGDLKTVGSRLVEMHGQHEHQYLMNPETHISYLDAYLGDHAAFSSFADALNRFRKELRTLQSLEQDRDRYTREFELKSYHLKEMQDLAITENELSDLQEELSILENSELLSELSSSIAAQLYEEDGNLTDHLKQHLKDLKKITQIDASHGVNVEEIQSALISLTEFGRSMASYRDGIPHDQRRLEQVRQRLSELFALEKKHHLAYPELFAYYRQLQEELREQTDFESVLKKAGTELEKARKELSEAAADLHKKRKSAAVDFSTEINRILKNMEMKHASLKVEFRLKSGNREPLADFGGRRIFVDDSGLDDVEFLIITNPGDSYKPLNLIASGGELSRFMLAIKVALSASDSTGTLIFDEADSGISGQTARTVGQQIQALAEHHQVLCITHLPQIASLGEHHFSVEKHESGGKNETVMRELDPEQRRIEIAKLIGAGPVTERSMEAADELLAGD